MSFYMLSENENGNFEKDGKRYDLLSCERTESLEFYETGEYETDEEGNQFPIIAQRVVINKGWTQFDTQEKAIEGFGITEIQEEENGNSESN